jgi:hypothetical protein
MTALALKRFQTLLARGPAQSTPDRAWRWEMHRALTGVRDDLSGEHPRVREQWLASRGRRVADERDRLLARVSAAGSAALHAEDLTVLESDLDRLGSDLARHAQRLTDLAWDDVELELGGSE